MPAPLLIGLDAGGTSTSALAVIDGEPAAFSGPGAQVLRDGVDAVAATLADVIAEARSAFDGAPVGAVGVGVAGAGRAAAQDALARALEPLLPDTPIAVTHDAEIALLAAWGGDSGALLIAGTGSNVYARTHDGETVRAGGWGRLLGDDGSGTALGRAALRAVRAAADGGPPTALTDLAADAGLAHPDDITDAVYVDGRPLATFAPLLLAAAAADDWVATAILARETNALAQQAGWLATRTNDQVTPRIAYVGGLTKEDVYRAALDAALGRHLPGWTVGPSVVEPVVGALGLARQLLATAD